MKRIFLVWLTILIGVSYWIARPDLALSQETPTTNITSPANGQALRAGEVFQVTGVFWIGTASFELDISIDGGPWTPVTITSLDRETGNGTWTYDWVPPVDKHTLQARVTVMGDYGPEEEFSPLIIVTAYLDAIASTITSPVPGQEITGGTIFPITGTVFVDPFATGLSNMEVSTDGGASWNKANFTAGAQGMSNWTYNWNVPTNTVYNIRSRATETYYGGQIQETPGAGITVTAVSPPSVNPPSVNPPSVNPPSVNPPTLISPVDTEVNTVMPIFIWTPVQGADRYRIWVSTYSNPEDDPYYQGETKLTHAIYPSWARPLSFGQRYYWRVQALNTAGGPVGASDGKSEIAYFIPQSYLSPLRLSLEEMAEIISRFLNPEILAELEGYELMEIRSVPPGEESELIEGIRDGAARISSARVESR